MSASTIKLNGKVYDSGTGALIGGAHKPHSAPKKDAHPHAGTKPVHHTAAAHKAAHKTQKARTLMRHAVKKPVISAASAPAGSETAHDETVSMFLPQLSESRLKHAKQIHKSKMISRFGNFSFEPSYVKRTAVVPVKAHPDTVSPHEADSADEAAPPADLFTSGLHQATGHTQRKTHVKHHHTSSRPARRKSTAVAVVSAIIILSGFFAYQNKPNAEFRVAAAKAGIHATLPGYHPSGFAMKGPVQYSPGQVTVSFQSNSDNRNFTVSQQVSNWNSSALVNNYVASADNSYQTVQDKGRTIYIYGDSNATWVDGGIWYQIQGNSSLSSAQLVKIVNSI